MDFRDPRATTSSVAKRSDEPCDDAKHDLHGRAVDPYAESPARFDPSRGGRIPMKGMVAYEIHDMYAVGWTM